MNKKHFNCNQKKITKIKKKKIVSCHTEIILPVEKFSKIPISAKNIQLPIRRQTYLIGEKENLPVSKRNTLCRDTILTSPQHSIKRPDHRRQDHVFNKHFNLQNLNKSSSSISDDSLEKSFKNITINDLELYDINLTPLKSTENLISELNNHKEFDNDLLNFNDTYDSPLSCTLLNSSQFKSEDGWMNTTFTYTPEDRNPTNLSINLCSQLMKTPNEELNNSNFNIKSDTNYAEDFVLLPSIEQKYTTNHNTSKVTYNYNIISTP